MILRKLPTLALLTLNLLAAVAQPISAQTSNVDIQNRVLVIETDDSDDLVEVYFEDGEAIIQISQFQNGSLGGLGTEFWGDSQMPGWCTDLFIADAIQYRFRTRNISRFDQIEISTFGGADTIIVNYSVNKRVKLDAGDGDDEASFFGGNDGLVSRYHFLAGGDGDDVLVTQRGSTNAVILGESGDDYLVAAGGDRNYVYGGIGDDLLDGGDGDDYLSGDSGHDEIYAGKGKDYLSGGSGNDYLNGRNDGIADTLVGGSGYDELAHRYYVLEKEIIEYQYYEKEWDARAGKWKWVLRTRLITRYKRVYTETEYVKDYNANEDILREYRDYNN